MSSTPRLPASSRMTGMLWGAIVTGAGAAGIAIFSGYEVDLGLLLIGVLAVMGLWLVLSALASSMSRRDRKPLEPLTSAAYDAADEVSGKSHERAAL